MKTILVIEDDPVVQIVYQRFLQSHGFAVELAADGADGLAKLASVQPDAVVLDVMLPKVDGIAVLYAIRAQEAFRDLPVLMLTNAVIPAIVEEVGKAGADHVFDKSSASPFAVVEMLQRLLQTKHKSKRLAGRL